MSGISQWCKDEDGEVEVYIGSMDGTSLTLKFTKNSATDDEVNEISAQASALINKVFDVTYEPYKL